MTASATIDVSTQIRARNGSARTGSAGTSAIAGATGERRGGAGADRYAPCACSGPCAAGKRHANARASCYCPCGSTIRCIVAILCVGQAAEPAGVGGTVVVQVSVAACPSSSTRAAWIWISRGDADTIIVRW